MKNTFLLQVTGNFLTYPYRDLLSRGDICKWRLFTFCEDILGVAPIFEPESLPSVLSSKEVNLHAYCRDPLSRSVICESGCFRTLRIC